MFLFCCFFLYLVACAMVNVYKGIGKENCALLFVCFCIFSVINCRMCQLSMCACVCVRELFSLPLFVLYIVSWKCVVVHCGPACGWEGPMNPPCGH